MEKEDIWDMYFKELCRLITSSRTKIEELIRCETEKEFSSRWPETAGGKAGAYADAAIDFLEERLYSYSLDHFDRFLHAASRGMDLGDIASIELALSWYDWREEKAEIDGRVETALNLAVHPGDIIEGLLDEFGAFPDKTIIRNYVCGPSMNRLPDYALSAALEESIKLRN